MEDVHEYTNTNGNKSVTSTSTLISKMDDSSTGIIYHDALQDSGNLATNAEWSETSSTFSPSSSYSHINTETYKECCANPSDTLKNKNDFMIVESVNASNSKIDDTSCSIRKITHFQKSHKPFSSNSHVFENIIVNDSEIEITQNSVCLNRFQKRRKLSSPNGEVFVEINKSNNNGMNSVEVSMTSPKFLSKKIKDLSYFNMPDYNLSTTDTTNSLITADNSNISEVKKSTAFKKPSDSSLLVNDITYNIMDESKTELLTRKFTKKRIDTVNSAFDNIINDSSITSDNISNITKTLNDTAVSNVNRNESCSTMELPSLNHTYDIPAIGNSTQIPLSQSVENISEMYNKSITQPINETYTLEIDLIPNKTNFNESSSVNLKNTHSNTYTNENNSNETLNQPKYMDKTINTLADMSNIYNQSKSSEQKPNFIRKFQLKDTVPQDYNNIIIDDSNSAINDTLNITDNNKFKRFKLKKTCHEDNSKIFDNIISNNQTNEISVSQNANDLCNISSESKSGKNIVESIDKTLPHQSNVILEKDVDTIRNMNHSDVFLNKSSNSFKLSGKFNFSKQSKLLSQSFQENSIKFEVIKQHSISSMDTNFNKTIGGKSNILNISANNFNDHFGLNSQNSDIQKEQNSIQMVQPFNEPISSSVSNILKHGIENDKHEHSTFNLSQSQTPHFTGKHILTANSGVFSNLVDYSVNSSDTSLNISKQVKFKNYKNVHEHGQSLIFENVIKSSQESNLTLSQNKTLSNTVLYDQNIIQSDEISMFANVEELLSDSQSLKSSDQFFKKVDTSKMVNMNKSKTLEDELNITTSDSTLNHSLENKNSIVLNISAVNDKPCNSTRSVSSVIGNNTLRQENNSLKSESINNHSLSNITAGLLENDDLTSLTSKNLLVSNNTNLSSICNETFSDHNSNTSKHSSIISNNENLTLNSIPGPSEPARSQRNQSKTLSPSIHSSSSTSYDEGLTLFTTGLLESDKSLESNKSSRNETNRDSSKNSLISTSINQESTLLNLTSESLESVSRNETYSDSSKNSLISTSNNQESRLLNTTSESLESDRSSRNQSNSLALSNYSTRSASISEELITLSTTARSSEQNLSSISQPKASKSKDYSLLINTKDVSKVSSKSFVSEDNKNNVSRISTRSCKRSKNSFDNVEQEIFNAKELPPDNGGFATLNTTARSSEQNSSSISQPKASTSKNSTLVNAKDVSNASSKSLIPEDNKNNVSRISTRSCKRSKNSFDNVEQEIFNAEELPDNGGFETLNTTARSSEQNLSSISQPKASTSKNSTLVNAKDVSNASSKSLIPEDNKNNVSRVSTRSSKQRKNWFDNVEQEIFNAEELPDNGGFATLNTTARSSEQNLSSISQPKASTSKNSTLVNAKDVSNASSKSLIPEDNKNNVSRVSTRSSKQRKNWFDNVEQEIFNAEELPDNGGFATLNTTARSSEQNLSSISQPKASTSKNSSLVNAKDVSNASSKSLIPEDNKNNVSRISTRSCKRSKNSFDNVEQEIFNAEELLDNGGFETLNTTARSSEQNLSSISQPKASTSKNSSLINAKDDSNASSKSLIPEDNKNNVSRVSTRSSKQRKNWFDNVEQEIFNAEELPDNGGFATLNTTARSSEQNLSSISQPKASTSKNSSLVNAKDVSNASSKSLIPEDNKNNVSRISTRSCKRSKNSFDNVEQEIFNADELPDNGGFATLNTTARSSEQNLSSISQPKASTSKNSSLVNVKDVSNASSKSLIPEDNKNNVSRISTRSCKRSKNSFDNVEQEIFNAEELPDDGGFAILNTTARSSEHNLSSISQPKSSDYSSLVNAKDVSNVSSKSLMLEDNTTNVSRISTRSSKQSKSSLNNTPAVLKMTNCFMKPKISFSTRVTRSSASTVNKSLLKRTLSDNKSMLSENNGNYISTRSYRTLNSSAKSNNETGDHDDSIFWTTIPDNTTSKTVQNINTFETPRNNKLAVEEQIINTIGIMSVNKQKATHPGVFELEDRRPSARLTIANSFNQTPSILSKVLAGNNFNKTMSDTQSLTETLIDSTQVVEETVTTKFKSLYNRESWITKRLYNFVVSKLLPKYNIYSVKYAEKFIKYLASIMKQVSGEKTDLQLHTDVLRYHMARYGIINDTFDYMQFLTNYIPHKYFKKIMPNNIPNANNKIVQFDHNIFIPIMDDEEFLNQVLDYLKAA